MEVGRNVGDGHYVEPEHCHDSLRFIETYRGFSFLKITHESLGYFSQLRDVTLGEVELETRFSCNGAQWLSGVGMFTGMHCVPSSFYPLTGTIMPVSSLGRAYVLVVVPARWKPA